MYYRNQLTLLFLYTWATCMANSIEIFMQLLWNVTNFCMKGNVPWKKCLRPTTSNQGKVWVWIIHHSFVGFWFFLLFLSLCTREKEEPRIWSHRQAWHQQAGRNIQFISKSASDPAVVARHRDGYSQGDRLQRAASVLHCRLRWTALQALRISYSGALELRLEITLTNWVFT